MWLIFEYHERMEFFLLFLGDWFMMMIMWWLGLIGTACQVMRWNDWLIIYQVFDSCCDYHDGIVETMTNNIRFVAISLLSLWLTPRSDRFHVSFFSRSYDDSDNNSNTELNWTHPNLGQQMSCKIVRVHVILNRPAQQQYIHNISFHFSTVKLRLHEAGDGRERRQAAYFYCGQFFAWKTTEPLATTQPTPCVKKLILRNGTQRRWNANQM